MATNEAIHFMYFRVCLRLVDSSDSLAEHISIFVIPSDTYQVNPSEILVPAYPILLVDNETTDLSDTPGPVGIFLNGVSAAARYFAILRPVIGSAPGR